MGYLLSLPKEKVLPIVTIVVPFVGLTKSILRIPKGNPQKRNYNGDCRYNSGCKEDFRASEGSSCSLFRALGLQGFWDFGFSFPLFRALGLQGLWVFLALAFQGLGFKASGR